MRASTSSTSTAVAEDPALSPVEVCVGRIGKAHGIRGEVSVEVRTDEPERRFAPGARLRVEGRHPGLPAYATVESVRRHQDRLLLRFVEVPDRDAAELSRGAMLYIALAPDEVPTEPEAYYDHQLVGLAVVGLDDEPLGTVCEVLHHGAQDLLVVDTGERQAMVPFVTALVPTVDLAAGRIVVADRPGLIQGLPDEARE